MRLPTHKSVNYSYPSSSNAKRFGFADGCWTISVSSGRWGIPRAVSGHGTKEAATAAAEGLPLQWAVQPA